MGMFPDKAARLAQAIDDVEADLVRLQSRLYRVRQALEEDAGRKVGHQYDNESQQQRAGTVVRSGDR